MSQPVPSRSDRVPWWRNPRGEWYVIGQMFLFALIALGPGWIDVRSGLPSGLRAAGLLVGGALGGVGLVFVLGGLLALGDNLSPLPHPQEGATLVQSGMYSVVRHPIYSGLILGAVGWALVNASLLTLVYAAILFVFFDVKSRREERWLARKLPAYDEYRRRVRKLIPFVY